jgi:hypothetical protein
LRVSKGIPYGLEYLYGSLVENLTTNLLHTGPKERLGETNPPVELEPPVTGRVENVDAQELQTVLHVREGVFTDDRLLVTPEKTTRWPRTLPDIAREGCNEFLHVSEPFGSPDIAHALKPAVRDCTVRVLVHTLVGREHIAAEVAHSNTAPGTNWEWRKIDRSYHHARFALTKGRAFIPRSGLAPYVNQPVRYDEITDGDQVASLNRLFNRRWSGHDVATVF